MSVSSRHTSPAACWWSTRYAPLPADLPRTTSSREDLLWIGREGEMGFVLPHLQFFVGCLDGGNILLNRSGWRVDIEDTLEEKAGRL